jgi:hypothetical protein
MMTGDRMPKLRFRSRMLRRATDDYAPERKPSPRRGENLTYSGNLTSYKIDILRQKAWR